MFQTQCLCHGVSRNSKSEKTVIYSLDPTSMNTNRYHVFYEGNTPDSPHSCRYCKELAKIANAKIKKNKQFKVKIPKWKLGPNGLFETLPWHGHLPGCRTISEEEKNYEQALNIQRRDNRLGPVHGMHSVGEGNAVEEAMESGGEEGDVEGIEVEIDNVVAVNGNEEMGGEEVESREFESVRIEPGENHSLGDGDFARVENVEKEIGDFNSSEDDGGADYDDFDDFESVRGQEEVEMIVPEPVVEEVVEQVLGPVQPENVHLLGYWVGWLPEES